MTTVMKTYRAMTWQQLWHRAGRRGTALLILALMDFTYGSNLLLGHTPANTYATTWLSAHDWGYVWIIIGALLLTGAGATADRLQFALAGLFKTLWASAILVYDIQHPGLTYGSAAPWLALVAFIVLIAGWSEPPV